MEKKLVIACKNGDIKTLELLFRKGFKDYEKGLGYACILGNKEVAELFLSKMNNNLQNYNTGLLSSCVGGNIEIVKWMISKGADDFTFGLHSVSIIMGHF